MQPLNQFPVTALLIGFIVLAIYGAWLIIKGVKQYRTLHFFKGSSQCSIGALLCIFGLALISLLVNLTSYARLTHEQTVADLYFSELAPQRYHVAISFSKEDREQTFEINGDEWQLDAKVLKWHGYANLLGLDAQYKLHRLSGRYQMLEQARTQPASVYQLHAEPGIDLWEYVRRYPQWLPLVDAYYGSAVFLPMQDKAHYEVSMTQSGLIARPAPPVADTAKRW